MRILFVSVEVAPFAKVGGLADVAGALPKALRKLGHDARVVMPLYRMVEDDPAWSITRDIATFDVDLGWRGSKQATYNEMDFEGVPVGFIGADEWYTESVDSASVYQPGGVQHLFFSRAVLQAMEQIDWIPDVVHCNDWHTGFLPVLMRASSDPIWQEVGSVYTIHNLAYQGEFGMEALDLLRLPHSLFHPDRVEAYGRVNFLKAGCVYSDRVNTVSENYAREIQTPEFGVRLDGLMAHLGRQGRLSGIVNGIDTEVFDPSSDPNIPAHFSSKDLSGKALCRSALFKELHMEPIEGAPLLGIVSRLSSQKGMDLLLTAAEAMFSLPVQLVVQGLGEPWLASEFRKLEERYPRHFRFVPRFDAPIAQRIYAGCDGFLMPSAFEPCGLGQMISMRYGTVPIVRATGGLADTVFEGKNGFVFQRSEPMELLSAISRAHACFQSKTRWEKLVLAGMREDHSWAQSAQEYARLYEAACSERAVAAKTA